MALGGSQAEGSVAVFICHVDVNSRHCEQEAHVFRMALGGSAAEGSDAVLICLIDINPRCCE